MKNSRTASARSSSSAIAAPCIKAVLFLSFSVVLITLFINYASSSNNPSLFSLPPSLPLPWHNDRREPPPSSFSGSHTESPPPENSKTALYPTFTNPKMQRAVANLVNELKEESLSRIGKNRDEKIAMVEAGLAKARALIKNAIFKSRVSPPPLSPDSDYVPQGQVYRNPYAFQKSFMMMESMFKIYVYEEGELPMFHNGPTSDIYTSEGIFIGLFESDTRFRTQDPDRAHVYFLPFSVSMILQHLFDPAVRDKGVLDHVITDYVRVISNKYPYWNRSLGADHFMLACHDWGPRATWYNHHLYFTSMRALCNANTSEFFNPRKDLSIPELDLKEGLLTQVKPNQEPSNRKILAFFAGGVHGPIRGALFHHWKDKDKDIIVVNKVPENSSLSYQEFMHHSKFCLCPSGYQVASQRVVEAIYAGCVPVLINKDFVPPFSDVLDWDKLSVNVAVRDLPELKRILEGIGEEEYEALRQGVGQVQRHFVVNNPPKRYDVFHMVVHSLWLRRLNLRINS
ncbi:probable glycosyltransferase At3g07620 [Andrographis paniculata]|uniref:probable glycosyltransferase At3g07620 n=1 Tax=Andrographis paniculata TaxID=175694 RepID=UPI0021E812FF|nr:probable glycosyltransferase At3g07620 [Andrographis paniculata]